MDSQRAATLEVIKVKVAQAQDEYGRIDGEDPAAIQDLFQQLVDELEEQIEEAKES